jgi:hypothetical protein
MTRALCLATLIAALACAGPANPAADLLGGGGTGLEGQMMRGPITPVCRVDVPCDGPFSSWFVVFRGASLVARFHSDSAGAFRVALAPGAYAVMPSDTGAITIIIRSQRKDVTVGPRGYTRVTLLFDTGIR